MALKALYKAVKGLMKALKSLIKPLRALYGPSEPYKALKSLITHLKD